MDRAWGHTVVAHGGQQGGGSGPASVQQGMRRGGDGHTDAQTYMIRQLDDDYRYYYRVTDRSGDGVLFSIDLYVCMCVCMYVSLYLSFFLSFFLSLLARLRENGCTDLHEILKEGAV